MNTTSEPSPSELPAHDRGRLTVPRQVREKEKQYVGHRRQAARVESAESAPLVGLALSGGGIRSATLALGVLQTLARKGVLRLADYMCTVSGGGYMGACLSSLLTLPQPVNASDPRCWDEKAKFDLGPETPLLRTDQIHHLRKHGDFLILRRGLLRKEVLRAVGTFALGLACTLAMFVSGLLIAVGLLFWYGDFFGASPNNTTVWEAIKRYPWVGWQAAVIAASPQRASAAWVFGLGAVVALVTVPGLMVLAAIWAAMGRPMGETPEDRADRFWLQCFAIVILLAVGSLVIGYVICQGGEAANRTQSYPYLLLPAVAFAGSLAAVWLMYILLALSGSTRTWTARVRSLLGAMQGLCLYLVLLNLLAVALILTTWWLSTATLPTAVGGVALLLTRLLVLRGSDPEEEKTLLGKLLARLPQIAVRLAVPVFLLCALLAVTQLLAGLDPYWFRWLPLWAGVVPLLVIGGLVNFNRVSPHYFYRDRLVEAYLRTEAGQGGLRLVRDDGELRMSELHDRYVEGNSEPNPAPYHLVLCALNLPGSQDLARRTRKSDHFIFSREFCGSSTTGYIRTDYYRLGETKLSSVATISGAAVGSSMGFHSSLSRAFALTLFNIRLGYWLVNPRVYDDEQPGGGNESVVYYPPQFQRPRRWSQEALLHKFTGRVAKLANETGVFWPWRLFKELLATTDARGTYINLSDGGHTGDNTGLYPLLQRRCKLVIVCDAECDPDYSCASLTAAMRQIYTDENVKVWIDLDQLRPADQRWPQQHYLIGRVEYPDCREPDSPGDERPAAASPDPDSRPSVGWLIYLKSSFRKGDEPAVVKSYAAEHPEFPHQTTADQFFDDDQFEAYRALGAHIATGTLAEAGLAKDIGGQGPQPRAEQLIQWCRSHYQPARQEIVAAWEAGDRDPAATARQLDMDQAALERALGDHGLKKE